MSLNYQKHVLNDAFAVAVLKLLAATTWTRIVAARHLVFHDRSLRMLSTCVLSCCGLLIGISHRVFATAIGSIVLIFVNILFGFTNLFGSCYRNLAAHQSANAVVINAVHHVVKEFHTFEFEDEKRIFLLVGRILHRFLQVVEGAEVLLPSIVDVVQ